MKTQINEQVIIRLAKPEDKYAIIEIQYKALKVLSAKDYNPKQLKALLKSKSIARKSPETIFIAEINQRTVGFASLLQPPNTIGAVFVHPKFARKNIGTKLLQHLEQEAIKNEVPILWVCSSLTGHGFYRANGYQSIRKTTFPLYSTYIPCIQMKKRLLPVSKDEIVKEFSQFLTMTLISIAIIFLSSLKN